MKALSWMSGLTDPSVIDIMNERHTVRQPESRVAQALRFFPGQLGVYLLHESLILFGGIWARSILYDHDLAHNNLGSFQFSIRQVWPEISMPQRLPAPALAA